MMGASYRPLKMDVCNPHFSVDWIIAGKLESLGGCLKVINYNRTWRAKQSLCFAFATPLRLWCWNAAETKVFLVKNLNISEFLSLLRIQNNSEMVAGFTIEQDAQNVPQCKMRCNSIKEYTKIGGTGFSHLSFVANYSHK